MKESIKPFIRKNIIDLVPYSSARSEFKGSKGIFLDANENPYGKHNRYPDPFQLELKDKIAEVKNITPEQILLANGSDGIVDLTYRLFCEPGKDKALAFPPTFGMYTVASHINNVELIQIPLDEEFQINRYELENYINDEDLKIIFLCSPNNPTGNHLKTEDIDYILNNFKGVTVIDEAYIDFNDRPSYIKKLTEYPRLIVLQTLSKSWGLAGARVGMAIANEETIHYYNKIKTPYNVSSIDQEVALQTLQDQAGFEQNLQTILAEKEKMHKALKNSPLIKKIYPSDTNFFLIEVEDGELFYEQLVEKEVIVRNQHNILPNCLRITVGKPEENELFFEVLKEIE